MRKHNDILHSLQSLLTRMVSFSSVITFDFFNKNNSAADGTRGVAIAAGGVCLVLLWGLI